MYVCTSHNYSIAGDRPGHQLIGYKNNTCVLGWSFEVQVTDFKCLCNSKSIGTACEPNPCNNGGTCHDGIQSYSCSCPPAYTGVNCTSANRPNFFEWVPVGDDAECLSTCQAEGKQPVSPADGNAYWVCAVQPNHTCIGDYRAGYNLHKCILGVEGDRIFYEPPFKCLCKANDTAASVLLWLNSTQGVNCMDTCSGSGLGVVPVSTGQDTTGTQQPFHVCTSDYKSFGSRPGYQLVGYAGADCVLGWGKEVHSSNYGKECLCYKNKEA